MKISEQLFNNKIAALSAINSIYARHGNGFDMAVNVGSLVICVHITKRKGDGGLVDSSLFYVEMQSGGEDVMHQLVEKEMHHALREHGVEFMTMADFRIERETHTKPRAEDIESDFKKQCEEEYYDEKVTLGVVKTKWALQELIDSLDGQSTETIVFTTWACAMGNALRIFKGGESE